MDRLIAFWHKHRPQVDSDALLYLREAGRIQPYKKAVSIKLPHQHLPYMFILLDGIVAGFEASPDGNLTMRELILPMDYFTGTVHYFSQRNRRMEYRTLSPITLIQVSVSHARKGQQLHPDLAELFQILKQRKITHLHHQVAVFQEKDHYRRYCLYRKLLPDWAYLLPHGVQYQFLQMGRASYYASKQKYLGK